MNLESVTTRPALPTADDGLLFAELEGVAVGMVSAYVPGPDVPPPWGQLRLEPGGRLYERLGLTVVSQYPRLALAPPIVVGKIKKL